MITDAQLRVPEVEPFGDNGNSSDDHISTGANPFFGPERFSEGEPSFLEAVQRTPGKPTNVTAVPYQTNRDARTTLYVTWTNQPAAGKVITGVEVEQSTTGNDNTWSNAFRGTTQQGHFRTALSPGSTRYFRVRNRDVDGWGPWSDVISGTTNPATQPGPLASLTATAAGPSTITVSWTPGDDGGSPITGYSIRGLVFIGGRPTVVIRASTESDVTSYTATGLKASTQYTIFVTSINAIGSSDGTSTLATTAAPTAPDAPTDLTATASGQTTINLEWTAPSNNGGAAITGYRMQWSPSGTPNWQNVSPAHSGTSRSYSHMGLVPNTTRQYRVCARNSVGCGGWSNIDTATTHAATKPSAPRSLTATADGQTTINLSWTAPINTGGIDILGYRIEVSTNGGSSFSELVPIRSTTSYSHTGLRAGATRHYRIFAINTAGTSVASNIANATTAAATAPGAPTSLMAVAEGQTTINLSWTAPTNTGGTAITGYRIEVSATSMWSNLVSNTNSTATIYAHTNLAPATTRYYRVRAINRVGPGAASTATNATTAPGLLRVSSQPLQGKPPSTCRGQRPTITGEQISRATALKFRPRVLGTGRTLKRTRIPQRPPIPIAIYHRPPHSIIGCERSTQRGQVQHPRPPVPPPMRSRPPMRRLQSPRRLAQPPSRFRGRCHPMTGDLPSQDIKLKFLKTQRAHGRS